MNYAIILAGGVGQRMRTSGVPKQFLEVFGKPIIVHTLEKFVKCQDVDKIVIACNPSWTDLMLELVERYKIEKVLSIVPGGKNRQASIRAGIRSIVSDDASPSDVVVIHDGVRPLIQVSVISENVRVAKKYGNAMTVRPAIESVCVTEGDEASFNDFKDRESTYSLTAPQSFQLSVLQDIYEKLASAQTPYPILDASIGLAFLGGKVHIVKDSSSNLKITTPEDYYILKAMLELEENKSVFGL